MPSALLIVLTAVVTAVAGYLMNQLPAIRQFSGSGWLLTRLLIWVTLVPVVYELLTSDEVASPVYTGVKYGTVALGMLLVLDLWKLFAALRGTANETEQSEPQSLRTRVLKGLQSEVAERLEDSLHEQVTINLLMQQQLSQVNRRERDKRISLEAIEHKQIEQKRSESSLILLPQRSLRRENEPTTPLDPQESILETFNRKDVGRKLLILGEPGAGKTTTLLKLAEALIEEAVQSGSQPIPIIFELSTWKDDGQSIHDWLIEQLRLNYSIDPKVGQQWLRDTQLLPLLDGLDELGLQRQMRCVDKINEFIKGLSYPHAVVCCRREEYAEGGVRLGALKGAVCLEALSTQQVRQYFCGQLQRPEIWQAVERWPGLNDMLKPYIEKETGQQHPGLLQIPLFVTILSVAYRPDQRIETKADLFDAYIERRLNSETRLLEREQFRRNWAYATVKAEKSETQTRQYVHWLAQTLRRESLIELLIERLQPRWLASRQQTWTYRWIVGLIWGLIWGLIGGLKADFQLREKPNQGILAVRKNIPLVALFSYPAGVLLSAVTVTLGFQDFSELSYPVALLGGIGWAIFFGFSFGGGTAAAQHLALRIVLTHTGKTPWNYARFLNYCAERRLLQRIGGRYRFIHRELLDHFAESV
ncbi:MAG: NACHT domain-containing protein [Cyanobacteria bacterium J06628_6]